MNRPLKVLFKVPFRAMWLILLISACCVQVAEAATPAGITLLQKMRRAAETVAYSARQTTSRQDAAISVAQVWDNGRQQRIEYQSPPVNKGDVQVDDGQHVWRYHRSENSVVQIPSAQGNTFDAAKFNQQYFVKVLGRASVSGRQTWIVGVFSRRTSHCLRKYWIDQKNFLRLRAEFYDDKGQLSETTQLSLIHFAPILSSRFQWKTPAGARVNYAGELYVHLDRAQAMVVWLKIPTRLPAGYIFESAVINKSNDEAWLRYSNSVRRFSIFEQRTSDPKNSNPQSVEGGWFWKRGGVRFFIAGLGAADARKLAASF